MTKKYFLLILVILVSLVLIGIFFFFNKDRQNIPEPLNSITNSPNLIATGMLVKNSWQKSGDSYCAQGSDYYTLKTAKVELILDTESINSDRDISKFEGKIVTITGQETTRQISCPADSQCPQMPDGEPFSCQVFQVEKIEG